MTKFEEFEGVMRALRAEDGCPWDRAQTHETLKTPCIEEACEVLAGVTCLTETGNPDNLKEELGDLLMQVVMNAQIAEDEGYFTMDDVIQGIIDKMVRRHPHVFGDASAEDPEEVLRLWNEVKKKEKEGRVEPAEKYLPGAFDEAERLIDVARKRKGYK